MTWRVCSAFFLTFLYLAGCKSKKAASATTTVESQPVAMLSKTTFLPGDSITIRLSEPLSTITVRLDSMTAPVLQQSDTMVTIRANAAKIGSHSLIIQGVTKAKQAVSDTLSIELWSDITPQSLTYSVLTTYPHQTSSFTQGLEFHKNVLYESTGLNGESKVMQVDLPTGSILKSVPLNNQYFGEGITIVNDRLYQLTWTSGVCFRYKLDFSLDKQYSYPTQGWGLTHRDTTLILSDGTNKLYFLTPSFQLKGSIGVYDNKGPVVNLNELEYVDGYVFANVWQTNRIVQIDVASGKVIGEMNMERILPTTINTQENVLNGIAYQPAERAFYVTGKKWPTLTKLRVNIAGKKTVHLQ